MYKCRFWIWGSLLGILLFFHFITYLCTPEPEVYFALESNIDTELCDKLINRHVNSCIIRVVDESSEPSFIITDHSDETKENYDKIDNCFYSPLVLYAKSSLPGKSTCFYEVNSSSTSKPYKIDFYSLLIGIEEGKSFEELGFDKNVAKGKAMLYIPDERSGYYEEVVNLFYSTLNHGKTPSEEDKINLKPRVDNILSKCSKVVTIDGAIKNAYSENKDGKLFIGPEYLYSVDSSDAMGLTSDNLYRVVYFDNPTILKMDLFIKNEDKEKENISKCYSEMKSNYRFCKYIGWRIKNNTFDMRDISKIFVNEDFQ